MLPLQAEDETLRTALIRSELRALTDESVAMDNFRAYFDGDQPLNFSTELFMDVFGDAFEGMVDNWCKVVVNATRTRIKLIGFNFDDDEDFVIGDAIWGSMKDNDIDEQQIDLTEGVLVESKAFVIVWPGEEEETADLDWQPGQLCRIFYDPDNRRTAMWAVKRWQTDFGEVFVTFYTPEAVWKFKDTSQLNTGAQRSQSSPSALTEIPGVGSFGNLEKREIPDEPHPLPNPFGVVPMVEFNNTSYKSEIKDTVPQQDAINKVLADMMLAGEFYADPQRFIETAANQPTDGWVVQPGSVWHFTPSLDSDGNHIPGQFGSFAVGDPSTYVQIISMWLQHVALTSSTPVRYFQESDRGGRGDSPSGESLLVDDKPLNDKVEDKQTFLGNRWMQVARLVGMAIGIDGADSLRGEPIWEDPRHDYRMSLIEEAAKMVEMGIPIEFAITHLGLTPQEIEILLPMIEAAKEEAMEQKKLENEAMMSSAQGNSSNDPT